jgi:hypothetical protein
MFLVFGGAGGGHHKALRFTSWAWVSGDPCLGGKLGLFYGDGGVVETSEEDAAGGSVVNSYEIARKLTFWHR